MTASPRNRAAPPAVGPRSWWLEEALRADPGAPCHPLAGEVAGVYSDHSSAGSNGTEEEL